MIYNTDERVCSVELIRVFVVRLFATYNDLLRSFFYIRFLISENGISGHSYSLVCKKVGVLLVITGWYVVCYKACSYDQCVALFRG